MDQADFVAAMRPAHVNFGARGGCSSCQDDGRQQDARRRVLPIGNGRKCISLRTQRSEPLVKLELFPGRIANLIPLDVSTCGLRSRVRLAAGHAASAWSLVTWRPMRYTRHEKASTQLLRDIEESRSANRSSPYELFAKDLILRMRRLALSASLIVSLLCPFFLGACSTIPTSGPSTGAIVNSGAASEAQEGGIQIVDVNYAVAKQLLDERRSADFSVKFGNNSTLRQQFGLGDVIEVTIWEAPPAALFGAASGTSDVGSGRGTVLPDQIVDASGNITVPFAGRVRAEGRTPEELQSEIAQRLRGIAHDPQVLVRLSKNATSYVTVVGDVVSSTRVPLTPHGEHLLDALASAGGVREAVDKVTIQLTRGDVVASLPLESVIRDTHQNVPLVAGDVVTALFQPYSFTALGAAGKNQEVNFEAQGITLAQALARAGGLQDSRSDAQGVFVFRFEKPDALIWPDPQVRTTPDGKVPVVYRINLRDPKTFFVAQSFMMNNNDVLYVSNAPIAELQKFLNLVFSVAYPVVNSVNAFK